MRRRGAIVLTAVLELGLGACQEPVPAVEPLPKAADPPVVIESGQANRILAELAEAIDAANAAGDVEPMRERVAGAALTMADAQYKIVARDPDSSIAPLSSDFGYRRIVTRSTGWPRSFVVATELGDGDTSFIYRIEQAAPRSPYQLVSWARLLAGATTPAAAAPELGAMVVEPDASGLVMSPQAAVEAYAAAKGGGAEDAAAQFDPPISDTGAPDPAGKVWREVIRLLTETAKDFEPELEQKSEVIDGSVFALSTVDAGALVFGQIKSVLDVRYTIPEGGSVNLFPEGYAWLEGDQLKATKSVHIEHLQTVVLAVPPAGAEGPIQIIAVAETPIVVDME